MNIEFIPVSEEAELLVPRPKPARFYIPKWYKEIPAPDLKNLEFSGKPGEVTNLNIKSCMPFLDAYTHGYIQETWTDIHIKATPDGLHVESYNSPTTPAIMHYRENNTGFSVSNIYYDTEFIWNEQWIPKLPEGFSVLYTSILNRFDLPFRSLDALIDADTYYHEYKGQYPFYIYRGFSGVIPAGTPMYQIIPIKREPWESSAEKYDEATNRKRNSALRKHLTQGYKKDFRQKKTFN
jgi:hypothetical protein